MREIRLEARSRGWRYRLRRWLGDPTAFRIDGSFPSGIRWILRSAGNRGYDRGWTVTLGAVIPGLAGDADFSVMPRDPAKPSAAIHPSDISSEVQASVGRVSGALAGELQFLGNSQEVPSGSTEFDTAYKTLIVPRQFSRTLVDARLAEQMLNWPKDAVTPHSVLAWRDPFGVHVQARLPGPSNWAAVLHLLSIAEQFSMRLPAPLPSPSPRTLLDRVVARFQD